MKTSCLDKELKLHLLPALDHVLFALIRVQTSLFSTFCSKCFSTMPTLRIVIFARPPREGDCASKIYSMQATQSKFVFAPKASASFIPTPNIICLCNCAVMFNKLEGILCCRIICNKASHGEYPEDKFFIL